MNEFKADCSVFPDTDHLRVKYNAVLGQIDVYMKDDDVLGDVSVFLSPSDSKELLKFLKENME